MPSLVLCAHGTANPDGQQVLLDLLDGVRRSLPQVRVDAAYVDVQQPGPAQVVADLYDAADPPVIVPLLLSTGYHVEVDIAAVLRDYPGTRASIALGPSELLTDVLVDRVGETGAGAGDAVVFAAAGSSRAAATRDAELARGSFAARWDGPVVLAYGSAGAPTVPDAVAQLRDRVGAARVVIVAYLVGPGHFHDKLHTAGADLVGAPLGADPRMVELIVRRYRDVG